MAFVPVIRRLVERCLCHTHLGTGALRCALHGGYASCTYPPTHSTMHLGHVSGTPPVVRAERQNYRLWVSPKGLCHQLWHFCASRDCHIMTSMAQHPSIPHTTTSAGVQPVPGSRGLIQGQVLLPGLECTRNVEQSKSVHKEHSRHCSGFLCGPHEHADHEILKPLITLVYISVETCQLGGSWPLPWSAVDRLALPLEPPGHRESPR